MMMTEQQYQDTINKVTRAHPDADNRGYLGGQIVATDGEFNPVTDITTARWLAFENGYGYDLIHIYDDQMIRCTQDWQ